MYKGSVWSNSMYCFVLFAPTLQLPKYKADFVAFVSLLALQFSLWSWRKLGARYMGLLESLIKLGVHFLHMLKNWFLRLSRAATVYYFFLVWICNMLRIFIYLCLSIGHIVFLFLFCVFDVLFFSISCSLFDFIWFIYIFFTCYTFVILL